MARRIDAYRIKRGDNLGDPELWNRRLEDIDLRIAASEEALSSLDAVANRVEQVSLDRINNVITPLVEETQQRIASIPALFSATSASSVTLGLGERSFIVPEDERSTWAVSSFVYAEKADDPSVWLHGRLSSFDRSTGALVIDVSDYSGSGSHAGWVFYVSGRRGAVGAEGAPGLTFRGGYSAVTAYAKNDVVRYDRSAWVAKVSTTGNTPPILPSASNAYWELLVERGSDGQETGAFETKYSETVTGSAKTTFTITGGYSPGAAKLAFLNGALLDESAYTATNGTTVVLASPASVGSKFDFRSFATFGVGVVPQLDLNLADLPSKDTALTNLGGTSIGRSVFKATTQAAARLAIDAPAAAHGHSIADVSGLQGTLDAKLAKTSNLSDISSPATAFANIKQAATAAATGVVELATNEEAAAGLDTARAVTPAGVAAAIAASVQPALGVGQSWWDQVRSIGTSYQNTTGRPIMVTGHVRINSGDPALLFQVSANGSVWSTLYGTSNSSLSGEFSAVIPAGHYYRVARSSGSGFGTIYCWSELR